MDTYRFINSKDVANHLRAIGYEFNAYEAAYFVERCVDATLDEKMSAWREIVDTMPDCPTAWDHNHEEYENTHDFLREYIDLQQCMLDDFEHEKGFVYIVRKMRYVKWPEGIVRDRRDLWIEESPHPYSSLAKCIDRLRAEREDDGDEFDRYVVSRAKIDFPEWPYTLYNNEIVLDGDFRPLEVLVGGLGEHNADLRWSLHDAFIKMPVPFMKGDVVIDRTALSPHPFVFDSLKFWNSAELAEHGCEALSADRAAKHDKRVARCDERHSWDDSYMVACGYELGEDYSGGSLDDPCDLCYDAFGASDNYLNLEYYTGPLDGELKMLQVVSKLMRGEIDAGLAANLARLNDLEVRTERLRRSYENEYVASVRDLY